MLSSFHFSHCDITQRILQTQNPLGPGFLGSRVPVMRTRNPKLPGYSTVPITNVRSLQDTVRDRRVHDAA